MSRPVSLRRRLATALTLLATSTLSIAFAPAPSVSAAADVNIVPLVPARLMETRTGPDDETIDGQDEGVGRIAARTPYVLDVAGRGGVAPDAQAVMLNVTAVNPSAEGFITVYPCTATVPNASNVNFFAGDVAPNSVLAQLSDDGEVCLYSYAETDIVVDVSGYVPIAGSPVPLPPARLLETRSGPLYSTVDGESNAIGRADAGEIVKFRVWDRGGVPDGAEAVYLNVTAILPGGEGFLTVFPCSDDVPTTSNVNYFAGDITPNAVLATVSDDGHVCIYTYAAADIIADIAGYLPPGGGRVPIEPARCADTRSNGVTFDGLFEGEGKIAAGDTYAIDIAGRCNIPADATAAYLNVTALNAEGPGFLTVWPCDAPRPQASNVNYAPGQVQPNGVLSKVTLDGQGQICIYAFATTDVIVDANGYVPRVGLLGIDELASGTNQNCALMNDGAVWCWGDQRQLGDGTADRRFEPRPTEITSATVLSSGVDHSCAVLPDGTAQCWGQNSEGQLGDGTTSGDVSGNGDRLSPVAVQNLTGVTDIDAGYRHTCAITDGADADQLGDTVWCFGNQTVGQLGPGAAAIGEYPAPVEVTGLPAGVAVDQIEAGSTVSCARLADGSVWCWGNSSLTGGSGVATPAAVTGISDAVDISAADGTAGHTCAVLAGGSVQCWGGGANGQLGDGNGTNSQTPVTVAGISTATDVDTGGTTSCALLADATARCWGANAFGQAGTGSTTPNPGELTPVAVTGIDTDIRQIEMGGAYGCAVLVDDSAVCWGGSTTWVLGSDVEVPALEPEIVGSGDQTS